MGEGVLRNQQPKMSAYIFNAYIKSLGGIKLELLSIPLPHSRPLHIVRLWRLTLLSLDPLLTLSST